jgi:DNA repair photolyase
MAISGTKEWAVEAVNCLTGCSHDCRYCYARHMAVTQFRQVKANQWHKPVVRPAQLTKRRPKYKGTVMFPSTHDILPTFLDECMTVLVNLLVAGNKVLIVTKPHYDCIRAIVRQCHDIKDQILFRFTIGATDNELLGYWEPGAPTFDERIECLRIARRNAYATSVSIEPMLDTHATTKLINQVEPHVTDTIWLGKMNHVRKRAHNVDQQHLKQIEDGQTDTQIRRIYDEWGNHPRIRWKESIKEIVGLEKATAPGLDV